MRKLGLALLVTSLLVVGLPTLAQDTEPFVFGDARPDAPALAPRGEFAVGVRTLELTNPGQLDVLSITEDNTTPQYDRPLTVEVWYPAQAEADAITTYEDVLGVNGNPERPLVPFTFNGRATRDAEPDLSAAPYPLLIVSHGYPGSRFMMTYLTENLASKGYVVVAIDHTDSTFRDADRFGSTLLNRPLDILFVLDEISRLDEPDAEGFLAGLADADNTGLIGYSMGGYGAINAAGAGFSAEGVELAREFGLAGGELAARQAGNEEFVASQDDRIQAVFAFAPWGMNVDLWDEEGLAGLEVPLFIVAGGQDDVSEYEDGIRDFYEGAVNSERYLLTLAGARHNVAPNPAPPEAIDYEEYMRYADNVWDSTRMNNIMQHFATVFFGIHLQGEGYGEFLDLIENANDGVYAVDDAGNFTDEHTYWAGFQPRSAVGLRLEQAAPAQ